jgi:hypothetical protein
VGIEEEGGRLHQTTIDIKSTTYNHFKSFYQEAISPNLNAHIETTRLFPKMVSDEEAIILETPCIKEEILEVIKGFKK